ncbi:hypothetical protein [Yersinia intermedia]|nr:hypothetical protein [Yersinia intermedia]UNK24494.1 hypothetical protein MNQ97_05805 [Yersinia intermedia]
MFNLVAGCVVCYLFLIGRYPVKQLPIIQSEYVELILGPTELAPAD